MQTASGSEVLRTTTEPAAWPGARTESTTPTYCTTVRCTYRALVGPRARAAARARRARDAAIAQYIITTDATVTYIISYYYTCA